MGKKTSQPEDQQAGEADMAEELANFEEFLKTYCEDRILPFEPAEAELIKEFERCINCGLCLAVCPTLGTKTENPYPGPRSVVNMLSRSVPEHWTASDVIYYCTSCGACEQVCPRGIPIPALVILVRSKVGKQDPALVPGVFKRLAALVREKGAVFEG